MSKRNALGVSNTSLFLREKELKLEINSHTKQIFYFSKKIRSFLCKYNRTAFGVWRTKGGAGEKLTIQNIVKKNASEKLRTLIIHENEKTYFNENKDDIYVQKVSRIEKLHLIDTQVASVQFDWRAYEKVDGLIEFLKNTNFNVFIFTIGTRGGRSFHSEIKQIGNAFKCHFIPSIFDNYFSLEVALSSAKATNDNSNIKYIVYNTNFKIPTYQIFSSKFFLLNYEADNFYKKVRGNRQLSEIIENSIISP
tara:strand:- start:309 stop:1061 length:753 start_codon:yes stop_codon:yes gene_type:complete